MHVVILCCFKLCIWFYIRSRALQSLCLCVWFYAESKCIFLILSYVGASFKYSVEIFSCCFFFNCRALCWSIYVWILNKSSKRHLPRGFLFRSIHSPPFLPVFVLLFCLYFLAILVCNFACDLCCFIVNVYSVESSRAYVVLFYYVPNQNKVFLSYILYW